MLAKYSKSSVVIRRPLLIVFGALLFAGTAARFYRLDVMG